MQMIDFNQYVQNQRMYGGTAGRKMGIVYKGKNYILKFPGNLKEQQMKQIKSCLRVYWFTNIWAFRFSRA